MNQSPGSRYQDSRRTRPPDFDIAVVGGGMAGAAAALALARAGFGVALLDAREPAPWRGEDEVDLRVVSLAPSSVYLLDELGVWPAIRSARVGPYERIHVWDALSGGVLDFDAVSQGYDRLGYIVENNLVQHCLWQALPAVGVHGRYPAEVVHVGASEDRIRLALADGDSFTARLVVAADGRGSALRRLAGIALVERDYAQHGVVAHVTTERPHESTAWQRFLPGGSLAFLPLADGRSSIVWSLPEAEARRVLALDDAAFLAELGVAVDFRLGCMLASTPRAAFPLKLQLAESYQAERLVLLGDAAHGVHPLAGQGVNLGLRDVSALREVLCDARAAGKDIGSAFVLRRYARRRRSADTLDARSFDALARIYAWQHPAWVVARGMGMNLLNRFPLLKNRLAAHAAGL